MSRRRLPPLRLLLARRSALLLALLTGCYAEELADLRGRVEHLQSCQVCAQTQLTQGLALALCSPPVRQLVDNVNQVCRREDVCLDQKITTLVGDADPTHTGRFISLMKGQLHVALYFSNHDTLVGGADGIYAQRLKRLIAPQPPWLPTTRFLIVSNLKAPLASDGLKLPIGDPAVKRAESRGQQVIEKILDWSFPSGPAGAKEAPSAGSPPPSSQMVQRGQILHWVYGFSRKKDETLLSDDQPLPGTDPSQSVWVFRIDCATPDGAAPESAVCQQCLPTLNPAASSAPAAVSSGSTP
jgi:hypothetical protein